VGGDPGRLTKAAVRNITVAIAFLLLLGSPPVLAAVDEFGERSDRAVAEVRANIAAYGRSPIIVQYSVPVPTLQQGDTAERQRAAAGDALLRRLARTRSDPRDRRPVKRYKHAPLLAMDVDEEALARVLASADVVNVWPDRLLRPGLDVTLPLIGADIVHGLGLTGAGHAIAILDSGVDRTHRFLAPRVIKEACFSTTLFDLDASSVCTIAGTDVGAARPCLVDGCIHGTHVAGIIAGDGPTFDGVAPGADIIAIQVFTRVDSREACAPANAPCILAFTSDIISGLEHVLALAASHDIAAVNMSLGGGEFSGPCDGDPAAAALAALRSADIPTVVAAGNSGYDNALASPACITDAVSVGATDRNDVVAAFSNSSPMLQLLAPGVGVTSSVSGSSFLSLSGTSMAAPHVAGAFALLAESRPFSSLDERLRALESTGMSVTDRRNDLVRPRIAIDRALEAIGVGPATGIRVLPVEGMTISGPPGRPFPRASVVYRVTNIGTEAITLRLESTAAWISVPASLRSIPSGETIPVEVSLGPGAAALDPGTYSSVVRFENVDGAIGDTVRRVDLTIHPLGAANDKFSSAVLLTTSSGTSIGDNVGATREVGEPDHVGRPATTSVWWRWIAAANGTLELSTAGSDFDTLLSVYTGNAVGDLVAQGGNDDAEDRTSRVSQAVEAGLTYYVAIDGDNGEQGAITLSWSFAELGGTTGSLSMIPNAGLIASGGPGGPFVPQAATYVLTNTGAASINLEVVVEGDFVGVSGVPLSIGPGGSSAISVFLNDSVDDLSPGERRGAVIINGIRRDVIVKVDVDSSLNDAFEDALTVAGDVPLSFFSSNSGATREAGEPAHSGNPGGSSIWWGWTATSIGTAVVSTRGSDFDTVLGVYQGNTLTGLTEVAANDDYGSLQSLVTFPVAPGEAYRIAVDGYNGETGSVVLVIDHLTGAPANDDFVSAVDLESSATASTYAATTELSEPFHAGNEGGRSVWWRYIAAVDGPVGVDTTGSDFDTLLGVYTGNGLRSLDEVASNDDVDTALGIYTSRVAFDALAGTIYYIAVDGWFGDSGNAQVSLTSTTPVSALVAAVLPSSRSIQLGGLASAFATVINASIASAQDCRVRLLTELPATFAFSRTVAATNRILPDTRDVPFEIAAGAQQSLVLEFDPSAPIASTDVLLSFDCGNTLPAPIVPGLNTIRLAASVDAVADVLAISASFIPGVVLASPDAAGVFAVSAINIGAGETLTANVEASTDMAIETLGICESSPATGACLMPLRHEAVLGNGVIRTYTVHVHPSAVLPFDPARRRLNVIFRNSAGEIRGSTGVAVATTL
jgi:hypothetical protein